HIVNSIRGAQVVNRSMLSPDPGVQDGG
ncbi:MAG: hypothetical protein C5S45_04835, partial [Candidatus Methanocomedens sp.]